MAQDVESGSTATLPSRARHGDGRDGRQRPVQPVAARRRTNDEGPGGNKRPRTRTRAAADGGRMGGARTEARRRSRGLEAAARLASAPVVQGKLQACAARVGAESAAPWRPCEQLPTADAVWEGIIGSECWPIFLGSTARADFWGAGGWQSSIYCGLRRTVMGCITPVGGGALGWPAGFSRQI